MLNYCFLVPLGPIYILVLYILGNIEQKSLFITSVTKVHGLDNHQWINT